jgi:hypothetical protein
MQYTLSSVLVGCLLLRCLPVCSEHLGTGVLHLARHISHSFNEAVESITNSLTCHINKFFGILNCLLSFFLNAINNFAHFLSGLSHLLCCSLISLFRDP